MQIKSDHNAASAGIDVHVIKMQICCFLWERVCGFFG